MAKLSVHTIRADDAAWQEFTTLAETTGWGHGGTLRELLRRGAPELRLASLRSRGELMPRDPDHAAAKPEMLAMKLETEAMNIRLLMDQLVKKAAQVSTADKATTNRAATDVATADTHLGVIPADQFHDWAKQKFQVLEGSTTTSALADEIAEASDAEETER